MLGPIKTIKGTATPLPGDDIDTDRIIPSRFLRCVTFDGLGENAFRDERFDSKQKPLKHPMNEAVYNGSQIIISGNNFGCGSSREHAPQAIKRAGFNAIVAESFAEIFYGNSSVLGLVCVTLPKTEIKELIERIETYPKTKIEIDIENQTLSVDGNVTYRITIKDTLRNSLLDGSYDTLPELMANKAAIEKLSRKLPPVSYQI